MPICQFYVIDTVTKSAITSSRAAQIQRSEAKLDASNAKGLSRESRQATAKYLRQTTGAAFEQCESIVESNAVTVAQPFA